MPSALFFGAAVIATMFRVSDPTRVEFRLYISVVAVLSAAVLWQFAIHLPSVDDIFSILWHGIRGLAGAAIALTVSIQRSIKEGTKTAKEKLGESLKNAKEIIKARIDTVMDFIRDHLVGATPDGRGTV